MPAIAAAPLFWGALAAGGATAAAGVYGANKSASAAQRGADAQTSAANHAADLESQSAAAALKFAQEQEVTRRLEHERTQAQNYGIYQNEQSFDRDQIAQRQARLAPYQAAGRGTLRQLTRPRPMGTVGSLLGR